MYSVNGPNLTLLSTKKRWVHLATTAQITKPSSDGLASFVSLSSQGRFTMELNQSPMTEPVEAYPKMEDR